MSQKDKIEQIIFSAIDEINDSLPKSNYVNKSYDTKLLGGSSGLDSLAFVNLIVGIEHNIEDVFNFQITLADERAMSEKNSPFRSVKSLSEYIEKLIEENYDE